MPTLETTPTNRKPKGGSIKKVHESGTINFKVDLLTRGLSLVEVAAAVGIKRKSLSVKMSEGFSGAKLRRRMEHFLGRNIWSSARDFRQAEAVIAALGFDPHQKTQNQLWNFARAKGIAGAMAKSTRPELIELIEKFASGKSAS